MVDKMWFHERIMARHPELKRRDVKSAWRNAVDFKERPSEKADDVVLVAVGADAHGRLIEMMGAVNADGIILVFHAMTPPSAKTLREIGLKR